MENTFASARFLGMLPEYFKLAFCLGFFIQLISSEFFSLLVMNSFHKNLAYEA